MHGYTCVCPITGLPPSLPTSIPQVIQVHRPRHPVIISNPDWLICFIYDIRFNAILPKSPHLAFSHKVKDCLYICVSCCYLVYSGVSIPQALGDYLCTSIVLYWSIFFLTYFTLFVVAQFHPSHRTDSNVYSFNI